MKEKRFLACGDATMGAGYRLNPLPTPADYQTIVDMPIVEDQPLGQPLVMERMQLQLTLPQVRMLVEQLEGECKRMESDYLYALFQSIPIDQELES